MVSQATANLAGAFLFIENLRGRSDIGLSGADHSSGNAADRDRRVQRAASVAPIGPGARGIEMVRAGLCRTGAGGYEGSTTTAQPVGGRSRQFDQDGSTPRRAPRP